MVASGLFGAPATKLWMMGLGGASVLCSTMNWKAYLRLRLVPYITRDKQFWRLATSLAAFPNSTEVLAAMMLLYQLRNVERLFGTRKFASFLFVSALVGQTLQVILLLLLTMRSAGRRFNIVAAGPYSIIFAVLYQFHVLVPPKYRIRVFGMETSDKWTVYAVAMHMLVMRLPQTLVPALAGVLASMVYSADIGGLKRWRFPKWVCSMATKWALPAISSTQPMGTRPQSTVPVVQQSARAADFAQAMGRSVGIGRANTDVDGQQPVQQPVAAGRGQGEQARPGLGRAATATDSIRSYLNELAPGMEQASEEQITMLQGMFPDVGREQVVQALQLSNNDPNRAVAFLLDSGS